MRNKHNDVFFEKKLSRWLWDADEMEDKKLLLKLLMPIILEKYVTDR